MITQKILEDSIAEREKTCAPYLSLLEILRESKEAPEEQKKILSLVISCAAEFAMNATATMTAQMHIAGELAAINLTLQQIAAKLGK